MAALYRLPVVFVCENNLYGEFTAQARHQAITDIADRAAGYGMPGLTVDGMDAMAVFSAAGECIGRARDGGGPSLLECKTYRYYDHVGVTGMRIPYRDEAEVDDWKARDAIAALELHLAAVGVLDPDAAAAVHRRVLDEIADAITFAEESDLPDVASLTEDVYSNPIVIGVAR